MLTCGAMRLAVSLSAALLASGVLLGLLVLGAVLPVALAPLSLWLVLGGAMVLAVTFLVALLPDVAHRLDNCQH